MQLCQREIRAFREHGHVHHDHNLRENCTKGCLTGTSSTNQCIASVIIMENCHVSWALEINFLCHIVEDVSCPGIGLSENLLGTLQK